MTSEQFTVYVDKKLLAESRYRVAPYAVQVCVEAGGPQVLIFGYDSLGRPVQFDSTNQK